MTAIALAVADHSTTGMQGSAVTARTFLESACHPDKRWEPDNSLRSAASGQER
jgi:hypothetical protein